MQASRLALLLLVALVPGAALAQSAAAPPDLDCSEGFDGLRSMAASLPGARAGDDVSSDIVILGSRSCRNPR